MTFKEKDDTLKEATLVLTICREYVPLGDKTGLDDRIVAVRDALEKWRRQHLTWKEDER